MKKDIKKYKLLNIKLTPQRIAILDYLERNKTHPSVSEIFKYVNRRFPSMSFATVYNTLNTLVQHGRIRELTMDNDKKRFDPNTLPHHHLTCIKCKRIIDVDLDYPLSLPENKSSGFKVLGNHIEFYGICSECSSLNKQQKKKLSEII